MKYSHFTLLPERAFLKVGGKIMPQGGGGSGGGGQPTQTNVTQTNIPEYARPYTESMLGATQQQLFNTQQTGVGGYDVAGNPLANGGYDAQGNLQAGTTSITGIKPYQPYSQNPEDYVAPFSPMQQQAFDSIANQQVASQIGQGTNYANQATQGALSTVDQANMYGAQGAQGAFANAELSNFYGGQGFKSGQFGQRLGVQGGEQYGSMGAGYGQQGAGLAGQNINTGQAGMQAGMSYGQNAQSPSAVQGYMNPYLQASLAPQQQLLNQQFGIQNAANQSQATQQGAFGGGRQAIMQGLNQQNQNLATNQLVSQGYNNAYNIANQNMQAASSLGMQGAGVGLQGLQGANAAYNTGIAGAQTGLAGVDRQLAGTAQGMQGAQIGLQGANQAGQLMLGGANVGLSGVGAQQAGYGLGLQGANTLGNLGQTQYGQQMGISQAQLGAGAQQQARQQQIINQDVQNYATAQQYPQQQLAFMNSMLRGLPLQTATTQQYQAAPSFTSQAAGLGIAGAGAYQLMKAEGGRIKEKKFAAGGIASGVPSNKLDAMLERLSDQQLQQKAQVPQNDPDTAAAAAGQQAFRQQMRNPGIGAAPAPSMNQFAGGGIVAFAGDGEEGSVVKDRFKPGATSVSLDQIAGAPSDEAIRAGVERISGLAGTNMAGKGLLDFLEKRKSESSANADKQGAFRAIEAGLGIMGGASPYAGVNIGQGGKEAIKGHMQDVKEQKAEEFAMAKAEFDVKNMSYQDRMNIVKMANEDEQKTRQILGQVYGSQLQAGATIEAARTSAAGQLAVEKERGVNQLALEQQKAKEPSAAKTEANFVDVRAKMYEAQGLKPDVAKDRAGQDLLVLKHPSPNDLQNIASFVGKETDYIAAMTADADRRLKLAQLEPNKKKEIQEAQTALDTAKKTAAETYKSTIKLLQENARAAGVGQRPGMMSTTPPRTGTGALGTGTFNWTGTGLEAANAN